MSSKSVKSEHDDDDYETGAAESKTVDPATVLFEKEVSKILDQIPIKGSVSHEKVERMKRSIMSLLSSSGTDRVEAAVSPGMTSDEKVPAVIMNSMTAMMMVVSKMAGSIDKLTQLLAERNSDIETRRGAAARPAGVLTEVSQAMGLGVRWVVGSSNI